MHLQAVPPLQRSPKRAQQGEVLRTSAAGNRGNMGGGTRHPFSVLSSNTSHRHGNGPTHHGVGVTVGSHGTNRRGDDKPSRPPPPASAPAPLCCRDDQEEAWSVVRPGYVREKIAMFASPRGSEDPGEAFSSTGGGLKVKGGWERESRSAKRPRRSGGGGFTKGGGEEQVEQVEEAVSVGEMVAFLEQRASEQQMTSVPLLSLQRSSASITLSRAPPSPAPRPPTGSGLCVEGSEVSVEAVRVWDLVARLESECVKSPSGPGRRLLRGVGRVLLTQSSSSSSSSSSPQPPSAALAPGPGSEAPTQLEVQRPRGSPQDPAEPQTLDCGAQEEEEEEPGKLFFSDSTDTGL